MCLTVVLGNFSTPNVTQIKTEDTMETVVS
jgi:hypothetical protein